MRFVDEFRDRSWSGARRRDLGLSSRAPLQGDEVCGGHTHSIYKYGVDDFCRERRAGARPGCPVCVSDGRVDDGIRGAARRRHLHLLRDMRGFRARRQPARGQGFGRGRAHGLLAAGPLRIGARTRSRVVFFAIASRRPPIHGIDLKRALARHHKLLLPVQSRHDRAAAAGPSRIARLRSTGSSARARFDRGRRRPLSHPADYGKPCDRRIRAAGHPQAISMSCASSSMDAARWRTSTSASSYGAICAARVIAEVFE